MVEYAYFLEFSIPLLYSAIDSSKPCRLTYSSYPERCIWSLNLVTYFFYFFHNTIADFYNMAGFPRVIEAIDGSLIAIKGPDNEEHLYVCHKGFHAINVMAVCNAQLLLTNVVSKWHGSVHDSAVFHSSVLQVHMENEGGRNGWLWRQEL